MLTRTVRRLGVAAPLLAVLAMARLLAQAPEQSGTGSIAGSVVRDLTTETVDNAQVTLIDSNGAGPNRTVSTTQAGLFKFGGLRAGRYELRATKPAFVVGSYGADKPERLGRPLVLAADAHIADVRVPVFTGAVVAGTVWSSDNQPVPRTTVVASRTTWLAGGMRFEMTSDRATTDDRGRFRIFGLPPGDYAVAATPSPGTSAGAGVGPIFFPATRQLEAATRLRLNTAEQRLDVDIHLPALTMRSIHVQVRAADGSDLSGSPVSIRVSPVGDVIALGGPTPRAGVDVVVTNLVPGRYRVLASASPSRTGETVVEVAASGPVQDVMVVLRHLPVLTGSIKTRSTGTLPRENFGTARVWLTEIGGATPPKRYEASAASNSRFTVQGAPPGRYEIDARGIVTGGALALWTLRSISRNGQPIERVIEVGDRDIDGLELTLVDDLATLSGALVTGAGRSGPAYFIVLIATTPGASGVPQAYYTRPAADGSYRLAGILEGEYALAMVEDVRLDHLHNSALLARFRAAATMTLTFAPGEEKRQDLRVGGLHSNF